MRAFGRAALFLGTFLLGNLTLTAQSTPPPTSASTIDLDVVVTPKQGKPVSDLQEQDFKIFDNKSPQSITSFRALKADSEPVHVILLIDAVNSFYQNVAYQREQIDKFLHANGGRLAQPLSLAIFSDDGLKMQHDFSTDGNEISTSLDQSVIGLRNIRRSSQWQASDRLQLSLNALRTLVDQETNLPGRKIILWVSPGWPLLSGPGIELDAKQQNQIFATIVGLSTQLRQSRITLYAVDPLGSSEGISRTFYYRSFLKGVGKPSQVNIGDLSLQVLAIQSGGLALSSNNDVTALLEQCVADTNAYYELSFKPATADHPNEYHALDVVVTKPGLVARTRTGYYAQP
jgi:VWFA-related protein